MTSLSLQDQMFLKRASKNLPVNEIDTGGAHLADTKGNLDGSATKGMKIAGGPKKKFDADKKRGSGKEQSAGDAAEQGHGKKAVTGEIVREATFKLNPKKKGMWKGKSEAEIAKAKTAAKKSGNVTREREAVFALNAKKGKFHKESEELFDENQPKFARDGDALAAAKQGWGKKQLGKEGGTSGTSAGEAAAQGHGKRAVTGQLDREETEMENSQVVEDGDARGQGTRATGKETLGPVRIKADGSAGEAAEQGHGKKPVRGDIYRDGHEGSSGELGALEGKGKTPIRGEICREDVQDILAAIMDDRPGEAYDAFTVAIAPLVGEYTETFKEYIQGGLLGVEEDFSDVEYDDDELEVEYDDSQNEEEEAELNELKAPSKKAGTFDIGGEAHRSAIAARVQSYKKGIKPGGLSMTSRKEHKAQVQRFFTWPKEETEYEIETTDENEEA